MKETKVKFKNFSSIVNAYWRQVQKNDERTERQTVAEWRRLNLICNTLKQSHVQNFSSTSQRDTLSSQRSITPSKIDAKWQYSNLLCSKLKQSHVQNFSSICQSMQEKTTEKCISYILSSKRGITPSKIDAKWWHSNLICRTLKTKSCAKFQLNMSKHVGEKCGKLYFLHTKSTKKLNSFKNWRKVTTLELAL